MKSLVRNVFGRSVVPLAYEAVFRAVGRHDVRTGALVGLAHGLLTGRVGRRIIEGALLGALSRRRRPVEGSAIPVIHDAHDQHVEDISATFAPTRPE
jgi:hypothetical protein